MRDNHFEEDGEIIARRTILASLETPGAQAFRILLKGKIVGGLILVIDEPNRKGSLDILFVDPTAHSHGIGQAAWAEVETMFPEIEVWTTHTPYFETRNIHFYVNRLGFHIVEYYNARHPDPHHGYIGDADCGGMFRFEKRKGFK
ncbi:MAG: GNAT family N-acetyltransferase [Kiritimatiellia bacterium]